jgi:hypothetical protein
MESITSEDGNCSLRFCEMTPSKETKEGRLARTICSNEEAAGSGGELDIEVFEHRLGSVGVHKSEVIHIDVKGKRLLHLHCFEINSSDVSGHIFVLLMLCYRANSE